MSREQLVPQVGDLVAVRNVLGRVTEVEYDHDRRPFKALVTHEYGFRAPWYPINVIHVLERPENWPTGSAQSAA